MTNSMQGKKETLQKRMEQRSSDYDRYGRYMAQNFTRKNLWMRFIAELGDIAFMLLPVILWLVVFILTSSGFISVSLLNFAAIVTVVLIVIFAIGANTYLTIMFKGQSFGKIAMRLKVVNSDGSECSRKRLFVREAFGKTLPMFAFYGLFSLFTNGILGILAFLVLDGLLVFIDGRHRSIIDFILKTKVVCLNDVVRREDIVVEKPAAKETPKAENTIDLHVISTFSHDGEYNVEDLFKQAKKAGVHTLSITDHNSAKANLSALRLAPLYEINYIPGISIDCSYKDMHMRILGYFIDPSDERFVTLEHENLMKEKASSMRRVKLFEEFTGIEIDTEQLLKGNRFQLASPELIARYVLNNVNYKDHQLIAPYLTGNKRNRPIANFVQDFFAPGAVAYCPVAHPKVEDMISLVKATGGVVMLEDPMVYLKDEPEYISELLESGVDGLEVFTPRQSKNDVKYLLKLVKKYNCAVSAGSEYHGEKRKEFILGHTTCPLDAEALVENFVETYASKSE